MTSDRTGAHDRGRSVLLDRAGLDSLIKTLEGDGFRVVGPTIRDRAIVLDEVHSIGDLPTGWTAVQEPGSYRLERRGDDAVFGFAVGPESARRQLFRPRHRLYRLQRKGRGFERTDEPEPIPRLALLGARACDLAAIDIQDRVFVDGKYVDPDYAARRGALFVVAVACAEPGGTCFCVSMGTGPRVTSGFDLSLTELLDGDHRFLVEVGSEAGAAVLSRLEHRPAFAADGAAAEAIVAHATASMGRVLDTDGIRDLLYGNLEHPRWDGVASRCLACANCTLVCPTCFCSTVEDTTDLTGDIAERWQRWDSCFTLDHSYVHGGSVRTSTRSRYRQWLTHKLASWIDQFGTSGCVGCGRCITWCPVGIDITEEVASIRATDARGGD